MVEHLPHNLTSSTVAEHLAHNLTGSTVVEHLAHNLTSSTVVEHLAHNLTGSTVVEHLAHNLTSSKVVKQLAHNSMMEGLNPANGTRGQFVEQKLVLSSNFRCHQIHICQRYMILVTLCCAT